MTYVNNKYFSLDNNHFVSVKNLPVNSEKMAKIKSNNVYILSFLSAVYFNDNFTKSDFMTKNMPGIMAAAIPHPDKITGFNTQKLGEKLKFLVLTLGDTSRPEMMQKFKTSFFYKSILAPIFDGTYSNGSSDSWNAYKPTGRGPKTLSNAFASAAQYYLDDSSMPVGIDLPALLDAIVRPDDKGGYQLILDFENLNKKNDMIGSVNNFIELLRSSKSFKEAYHNPNIIGNESELID